MKITATIYGVTVVSSESEIMVTKEDGTKVWTDSSTKLFVTKKEATDYAIATMLSSFNSFNFEDGKDCNGTKPMEFAEELGAGNNICIWGSDSHISIELFTQSLEIPDPNNAEEHVITSTKELMDKVVDEYNRCDVELDGTFFDFDVNMKEKDIISTYAEIQAMINGDTIVRNRDGKKIRYDEEGFIEDGEYEDMYNGNAQAFLEDFNNDPEITEEENIFERWDEDELLCFVL